MSTRFDLPFLGDSDHRLLITQVLLDGRKPGQKVGSSLDVEQLEGRIKNKWERLLSYLSGEVFVDRKMHC